MIQSSTSINGERVHERILILAEIGKVFDTGVNRVALSDEDKQAQLLVKKWMELAGMSVRHDNFGNMIGRKEGTDPSLPSVVIGSHIDSVRDGGRFDGVIGVIGGIEVVQHIYDARLTHSYSIEVIAFCEEEGSRFSDGLYGSRGMVGKLDRSSLDISDEKGVTRYEALKKFGFGIDPDKIENSVRKKGDIKLFLEMHIEQGPFLEVNNSPIGIVKGIAGPSWYTFNIYGDGGHAGTVPMKMRKDPMSGTAEVITAIEEICRNSSKGELVGTVGRVKPSPGGTNVIPSSVEFSLDLRDVDEGRRNKAYNDIVYKIHETCERRGLTSNVTCNMEIPPINCSETIINTMTQICQEEKIDAPILVSGAGHDAMLLSEITEIGMIFVRCNKGISHHPTEHATMEDIAIGVDLMLKTVLKHI